STTTSWGHLSKANTPFVENAGPRYRSHGEQKACFWLPPPDQGEQEDRSADLHQRRRVRSGRRVAKRLQPISGPARKKHETREDENGAANCGGADKTPRTVRHRN